MPQSSQNPPKLTQQVIDRIRCPDDSDLLLLKDHKLTKMGVKIYPSGKKTYFVRVRSNGINSDVKLGEACSLKLQQARQLAQKTLSEYALGEKQLEGRVSSPVLDDFFQSQYLPYCKEHQRSWATTECLYRNPIQPALGQKRMHQVTQDDCIQLQIAHRKTHAPASTNRVMILLRTLYNRAIAWQVKGVTVNPTQGIALYETNNKKERYLTEAEMQRLLQAIQTSRSSEHLLPIIQLLALTGARKREVLDLRWQDIEFDKRRWKLEKNKSGKTQYKPLSNAVVQLLVQLYEKAQKQKSALQQSVQPSDWVFANPKTGKPFVTITQAWNSARQKAGLPEVRIHDLRHNFASQLVNAGRSLYEVQKLLGHADVTTTQRYAHLSQERLLEAASSVRLPEGNSGQDVLSSLRPKPNQKTLNQVSNLRHQKDALALLREAGWQEEELAGLFAMQGGEKGNNERHEYKAG